MEIADDREARQLPSESAERLAEMQTTTLGAAPLTIAQLLMQIQIWEAQIEAAR